jgi:hypothetical protein
MIYWNLPEMTAKVMLFCAISEGPDRELGWVYLQYEILHLTLIT